MKVYNFFYKSIFIAFYNTWKGDIPHWNAAILYPLMIVLNLGLLLTMTGLTKSLSNIVDIKIFALVLYGILVLLNYFLFIENKKYKEIANNFLSMNKNEKRKSYIIGITMSILGYVIPIAMIVSPLFC